MLTLWILTSLLLVGCTAYDKAKIDLVDISNPVRAAVAANESNAEVIEDITIPEKAVLAQNTETIGTELTVIGKTYTQQSKQLVDANKKIDKLSDSKYTAVSILCLVLIGIGIVLMVNGRLKVGMSVSAGAMGTLVSTYAINALMNYMWLVGLAMAVIVIAAFGYVIYLQFIKNRAFSQVVTTAEILKKGEKLTDTTKELINVLQSTETKEMVASVKAN